MRLLLPPGWCAMRVSSQNKTTRTRPHPRDIVHSGGPPTDQTRDLEGITSWQKGVGPHSLWIEPIFFFSLSLSLLYRPAWSVYSFVRLSFLPQESRRFITLMDWIPARGHSVSHTCTQPGLSAHALLQRLWPHRSTEEMEDRFAILHSFIAKCQYNCTGNVLWCQVHSSHIHASHKTSLHYNSRKYQGKKSLLNI